MFLINALRLRGTASQSMIADFVEAFATTNYNNAKITKVTSSACDFCYFCI